ncbi:MAG: CpaF family protein, partial [Xanthobacteraceae bacterium]
MASRFSLRRVAAPELAPPADDVAPESEAQPEIVEAAPEPVGNPLLTEKLLDAKVRLHRRLIEEINLSAMEKLPEEEIRGHVQQLVSQYVLVERLALNSQ